MMWLLASLSAAALAQTTLEGWFEVSGELAITPSVSTSAVSQVRSAPFDEGLEWLNSAVVAWEFRKRTSLEGGYRFTFAPNDEHSSRLAADLKWKSKKKGRTLRWSARQRYTLTLSPTKTTHTLRPRIGVEWLNARFSPYFRVEPHLNVGTPLQDDKVRVTLGTKLPSEGPSLKVYTQLEQHFDGKRTVVLGLDIGHKAALPSSHPQPE